MPHLTRLTFAALAKVHFKEVGRSEQGAVD
jgi:hypothetical protein